MKNLTLALILLLGLPVHAVGLSFGKQKGWKFHDLSKEPRFQTMLSGAVGTLMKPSDRISTVMIYAAPYSESAKLGAKTENWKKIVVADSLDHGATIKKELTFKVGKEWRYFIQSELRSSDGDQTNIATMALVKDGKVIVFTFQQDPKLFNKRLKAVVDLYFDLKIDKT